jgi:hypothetical protein
MSDELVVALLVLPGLAFMAWREWKLDQAARFDREQRALEKSFRRARSMVEREERKGNR